MRETVIQVGHPTPLVGILSDRDTNQTGDTAFILLNSGIMHRVGACRLSVRLARSVTEHTGLPSVRVDFSGVGDSPPRSSGLAFDEAAQAEVIEVMDYLEAQRGIDKFILYGLCSGARIACDTAEVDHRILGLIQVDGFTYPTWKSYLRYYGSRLLSRDQWRARLSRWLGRSRPKHRVSVLSGEKADFEVPQFARDPGRDAIARQLRNLMERNLRMHCVFTGRDPYYFYTGQYRDCFHDVTFGNNLSERHFPFASHIFTEPLYQDRMVEDILAWLLRIEVAPSERQDNKWKPRELDYREITA